jgi:excisionase family DNA binding protein
MRKTDSQFISTTEAAGMLGVSTTMVQSLVDQQELVGWKTRGGHRRIALQSIADLQNNQSAKFRLTHKARQQPRIVVAVESLDLFGSLQNAIASWRFTFDVKLVDSVALALMALQQDRPDMLIAEMGLPRHQQEGIVAALEEINASGRRISMTLVVSETGVAEPRVGGAASVQLVSGPLTLAWLQAFLAGVQATVY